MPIRTYNMQDEQFAFHPALRSAARKREFAFAATRSILPRSKTSKVSRGERAIIPLGISHSLISIPPEGENFLRLHFYSKVRWRVRIDPTKHYFDSKFEITTSESKQPEWRQSFRRHGASRKS